MYHNHWQASKEWLGWGLHYQASREAETGKLRRTERPNRIVRKKKTLSLRRSVRLRLSHTVPSYSTTRLDSFQVTSQQGVEAREAKL